MVRQQIVTAQAVQLDLEIAGPFTRAIGFFVDAAIQIVLGFLLFWFFWERLLESLLAGSGYGVEIFVGLLTYGIFYGYPTLWETFTRGKTPGHYLTGTRVVTDAGLPISFRHAAIRASLDTLDFVPYGVPAFFTSILTKRSQRLGDLVAGTIVVREPRRSAAVTPLTPITPPSCAQWVTTADVSALPAPLYGRVRTALQRAANGSGSHIDETLTSLAYEVVGFVSPAPPAAATPTDVLHAVVVASQRREARRDTERVALPSGWVLDGQPDAN